MQEAAGGKVETVFDAAGIGMFRDLDPVQRLQRAFRLAQGRPEGGEVVVADQFGGTGAHGLYVKAVQHLPHQAPVMRDGRAAGDKAEGVAPAGG